MKTVALRILSMLLLTAIASAQAGHGTLTGTVTNARGALAPAAQISIRNPETRLLYEAGNDSVPQLPAGAYDASVASLRLSWDSQSAANGIGYINPLSSGTPRNGQVVIRFQF